MIGKRDGRQGETKERSGVELFSVGGEVERGERDVVRAFRQIVPSFRELQHQVAVSAHG